HLAGQRLKNVGSRRNRVSGIETATGVERARRDGVVATHHQARDVVCFLEEKLVLFLDLGLYQIVTIAKGLDVLREQLSTTLVARGHHRLHGITRHTKEAAHDTLDKHAGTTQEVEFLPRDALER